jgi:hypothetical protein
VGSYFQFGLQAFRLIFLSYNKRSARSRTLQPWITGDPSGDPVGGRTGPGADNVGPPSAVPVELDASADHQKPESAEMAEYRKWPNITSLPKALINAANHIRASQVTVCAQSHRGLLHLSIQDDGVGGANCARGSTMFAANGTASVTVTEPAELKLCNSTTAVGSICDGGLTSFVAKDIEISRHSQLWVTSR